MKYNVRNEHRLDSLDWDHPDLAAFVTVWPELPEAIKAGIVAMVKAASGKNGLS